MQPARWLSGLGATFYHMVTGRVPFTGNDSSEIMRKHLREKLIPPDHINTSLSAGVSEVIEIMMVKRREDRYNDVERRLLDLEALRQGQPPLHARKRFDVRGLEKLEEDDVVEPEEPEYAEEVVSRHHMLALILGAGLAVSLLVILPMAVFRM